MEASLYTCCVMYFVLTGSCVSSLQSRISLNSSLNDQHEVHRGENITFQCRTRGSAVLAWSSNESLYIDGRIRFTENQMIGTPIVLNKFTSARVTDMYNDLNGRQVIESQLSIIVQRSIRYFSVSCHRDSGQPSTLSFQLSDAPILTSSGGNMCDSLGEFQNITCEIRDSSILAWESDEYIGARGHRLEFLSAELVGTVKYSELYSGVFANLTANYLKNGVRILMCQLSIPELLYPPDVVEVICVNVGLGTRNSYGVTVNDNCDTAPAGDNPQTTKILSTTNSGATSIKNGTPLSSCWLFIWFLVFSIYSRT